MHKLYTTMKVEHERPVEGIVKGDIPDWVNGSLYRDGPGIYEFGKDKYQHMFDPAAMLQRFHVANKKVTYQSRYLRSENYKMNSAAQRIVVGAAGTFASPDPCKNIFQRFLTFFQPQEKNDNSIVNFYPMKDELYVSSETNLIHKIDPQTLDAVERVDISQYVAVNSATAHPHHDPDGTVHNIGNSYKGGPKTCIIKIPPKQATSDEFPKGQVMSAIKSAGKMSINYMHSFAITEHYYVYVEQPMFVNIFKILTAKLRGDTFVNAIEWWPNVKARFRILERSTGEEVNPHIRYEADAVMVFHHINAYEEDGHVVMDLCGFKTKDPLDFVNVGNLTSEECEARWRKVETAEARRYVMPLRVCPPETPTFKNLVQLKTTATAELREDCVVHCTWETLADVGFEFPQINYSHYNGKKYRYSYGVGWHPAGRCFHTLAKVDAETKTYSEWSEDKCYPSEPVFVANPNGNSEDDGVILSAVNNSDFDAGKTAFLLVLDAKTMTEMARVEFNIQRFPRDFHGMFRTGSAL